MRTNEEHTDHEEALVVHALTTRQWHVYDFTRQGYTQQEIAQLLGYSQPTIHRELKRALHAIANTLEQEDEGQANTHITTQRPWQGNTTAHLPDITLQQAIHRERQRQLRPNP